MTTFLLLLLLRFHLCNSLPVAATQCNLPSSLPQLICVDHVPSPKYNATGYEQRSGATSSLLFPERHDQLLCDSCIKTIQSDLMSKWRRCPICSRPTLFYQENTLRLIIAKHDTNETANSSDIMSRSDELISSVERGCISLDKFHSQTGHTTQSNSWLQFMNQMGRMQERDNSTWKEIQICQTNEPLRHRLRKQYHRWNHRTIEHPVFYLRRRLTGCVLEFSECLLMTEWCVHPLGCVSRTNIHYFSLSPTVIKMTR